MTAWATQKGLFGIKKGIWVIDIIGLLIIAIAIYILHVTPVAQKMEATSDLNKVAIDLQGCAQLTFAINGGLSDTDLNAPYQYSRCKINLGDFSEKVTSSKLTIPSIKYDVNSWGYVLASTSYVLTGVAEPKLVKLGGSESGAILNQRLSNIRNELFFGLL